MFYDSNEVQLSTKVKEVTTEDTAAKYRAWNWNVLEVDGTDPLAIAGAIEAARDEKERPTLIIGHTVMARKTVAADGSSLEGHVNTHGQPLSAAGADMDKTVANLGGDPQNPWQIWDDVKKLYADRMEELRKYAADRKAKYAEWAEKNPEEAKTLQDWLAGKLPDLDWTKVALKPNMADVTTARATGAGCSSLSSANISASSPGKSPSCPISWCWPG